MTDTSEKPTPPADLPETLAAELDEVTPEQLRNVVIHAQELLQFHDETNSVVEPGPGEDILRVREHDNYTEVVKSVTCSEGCSDCPHGPYLYHVREEPRPEGGTHQHWSFVGEVEDDHEQSE